MQTESIKAASIVDAGIVERIVKDAYGKYVGRMGKPPGPMLDDYSARIGEGSVWVIEESGNIVGVIVLLAKRDHLLLDNIAVAPAFQGFGFGRCLLEFVEAEAVRRGYDEIRLYTHKMMTENLRLYAAIGYEEIGRGMEAGYERIFMRKFVATKAPLLFDRIGAGYGIYRRPDPRIGLQVVKALGNADSVVNVGAGAGSYEPRDRFVVAIEPSQTMIAQRPAGATPVIRATAMALPFPDRSFAAAMAILTVHHWPDRDQGIAEMKRVARERVVIFTWEPPDTLFWLTADYLPHFLERDRKLFPPWWRARADVMEVVSVPVPHDCTDGFLCAYWRRPEAYLDPAARTAISTFWRVGNFEDGLSRLRQDLDSGEWHRRNRHLLGETAIDFGYRIVVLTGN